MANALIENLSAASALATTDLFYVKQAGARGVKATGTQLLALVGTAYVPLAGGTMTGALTIASGTLTASAPALNVTQTWNNAAVTFSALLINATNTASVAASTLQDWQVSGVSKFRFQRDGWAYVDQGVSSHGFQVTGATPYISFAHDTNPTLAWGVTLDINQIAPSTRVLEQRGSGGAQTYRICTLYTDSSNYERLTLTGVAGTSVNITAETLGTGGDNLDIVLTPAGTGAVKFPSSALVASDGYAIFTGIRCATSSSVNYYAAGTRNSSVAEIAWTSGNITVGVDTAFLRGAAGQVDVTNGTAATYRDLKLRNLLAGGGNGSYVQTPSMTVDRLADAATAGAGARAFVTDANATTFLSTVAAGGSNKVPVVSNGTNWLIG